MRRTTLIAVFAALAAAFAPAALAGGGSYAFEGGTAVERAQVHSALEASSFDWNLIPATIKVHIGAYGDSYATYGEVFLDRSLLDAGRFSWGVVQHEFGHQVDFFLLDDAKRTTLQRLLGGTDWWYASEGAAHSEHACERFASGLAWAYWPSPDNAMRPGSANDEAAHMPVAAFRTLLAELIGAPSTVTAASTAKAYAPPARTSKTTKKR